MTIIPNPFRLLILRLADNPSLYTAAQNGDVLPVYILDDENAGDHKLGGANRWWLHHSLTSLNKSLQGKMAIYTGNPKVISSRSSDLNL